MPKPSGPPIGIETPAREPRPRHALRPLGGSVHASLAGEIGLRIVRGDYPPGSILPNEAKWAETFKVSRSAVREAVKMLTAKSLLASRPKIGSRVEPRERWNLLDREVLGWYAAVPDRKGFLMMLQELRYIVEPEASALAAMRRSPEQLAEIARACQDMRTAPTFADRTEADARFHLAILTASGNALLVPLGVTIESALRHLFAFVTSSDDDPCEVQILHEAILRAIRLQRPEAARRSVRKLLANTDRLIAREILREPEQGIQDGADDGR